jgi:YVTN family beta-propeller protein
MKSKIISGLGTIVAAGLFLSACGSNSNSNGTADGSKLWVAQQYANTIAIIDTETNEEVDTINTDSNCSGPMFIAVTPDNTKAYVSCRDDDTVAIYDTETLSFENTIEVGSQPRGIVINPSGTKAYVANKSDSTVSVIDLNTNMEIATIDVGAGPNQPSMTPTGDYVYVANQNHESITVIQTSDDTVIDTILGVVGEPWDVYVEPTGTYAYVSDRIAQDVIRIRLSDNTVVDTAITGDEIVTINGLGATEDGKCLIIADHDAAVVSLDTTTDTVISNNTEFDSDEPWETLVYGNRAYVSQGEGGNPAVAVFDIASDCTLTFVADVNTTNADGYGMALVK